MMKVYQSKEGKVTPAAAGGGKDHIEQPRRLSEVKPERLADRVVVAFEAEGQHNLLPSEAPVDQLAETNGRDCKGMAARLPDPWTKSEAVDSA